MTDAQRDMIQKIKFALLGSVFVSLYMAGVLQTVGTFDISFNPFRFLKNFAAYGVPWKTFFAMEILIGGTCFFGLAKYYSDKSGLDKMGRLFKMSKKSKTYGDAHFEEPEEYEKNAIIQPEKEAVGTILGQLDESGDYPIVFREDKKNRLNRHIAIVGASGSGKTFTFTKNYAFQAVKRRESVIFTDPDGGLFMDMAGYFMDRGYVVRRFDLNDLDVSDGWNCMKLLTDNPDRVEENAELFASIIISNIADIKKGGIFVDGPKSLLKALLLRVALGRDYTPEEKHIGTVYQLLQNPAGEDFLDMMFDASQLSDEEMPCLGPYLAFKQGSANLRGNVLTNLAAQLNVLQTKKVRTVMSTDNIDLHLPGQQPCAYFCVFPDSHATYKFIVSLFFSMLFVTLTNDADARDSRRLAVPVDFMLDEFPSIGIIPDFAKKMATIRKRAMNVCMVVQDITQLQQNYLDTWATILSNCATFIDLGINDEFTADMVSKRIGETTVTVQTEDIKPMELIFNNVSIFHKKRVGEGKRSLMSFDEIYKMGEDDSIVLFQGHNPILAKKYPHTLHSEAKYLRPIVKSDIPPIDDTEGRKRYYQEQQRIYENYMAAHPNINKIDRSFAGKCEPNRIKTVWEDGAEAIQAYFGEMLEKHFPGKVQKKKAPIRPGADAAVSVDVEDTDDFEILTDGGVFTEVDSPNPPAQTAVVIAEASHSTPLDSMDDLFGDDELGPVLEKKPPAAIPDEATSKKAAGSPVSAPKEATKPGTAPPVKKRPTPPPAGKTSKFPPAKKREQDPMLLDAFGGREPPADGRMRQPKAPPGRTMHFSTSIVPPTSGTMAAGAMPPAKAKKKTDK